MAGQLPVIRVNTQVPFPAMVTGSGPITVGKVGGVWTVGFSITVFGSQNPPSGNFPTDFLLGYDIVNQVYFKISLTNLISAITPPSTVRTQRLATSSPITINTSTDSIINVNINTGAPSCTLPTAASRVGAPLTFKDVGGHFAANPLTITPAGGDNIDGGGAITLNVNRQGVTLVPANDGTTVGWSIE
jgi:hypothetical protein